MRSALHHLAQRGSAGTWHCIRGVPLDVRDKFPGKHVYKNLRTTDQAVAIARRSAALVELDAMIQAARAGKRSADIIQAGTILAEQKPAVHPVVTAAVDLARYGHAVPAEDAKAIYAWQDGIEQSRDEIAERYGPALARTFHDVATGTATPLALHVEDWLTEGGIKGALSEKAKKQYRSALTKLETWLTTSNVPVTIEAVTKQVVGRFITETMVKPGVDRVTANSWISPCSSYWRWLGKRAGVEVNPWTGAQFAKPQVRRAEKPKRPFTDLEMAKLLTTNADPLMRDVIRLAALTGMRRSELAALRVQDCRDGRFRIAEHVDGKNANAVRTIPVHSALAPIVARLSSGKAAGDYLLTVNAKDRGDRLGKLFAAHKEAAGIDGSIAGRRQDAVDFHSLRRWTITKMRKSFDQVVVADVCGHERGESTTDRVYVGQTDWEVMVACVESVRLPTGEQVPA